MGQILVRSGYLSFVSIRLMLGLSVRSFIWWMAIWVQFAEAFGLGGIFLDEKGVVLDVGLGGVNPNFSDGSEFWAWG